jgi:hypothetical protein
MDHYPTGYYVSKAMKGLPAAGPDSVLQTVEINADGWGRTASMRSSRRLRGGQTL